MEYQSSVCLLIELMELYQGLFCAFWNRKVSERQTHLNKTLNVDEVDGKAFGTLQLDSRKQNATQTLLIEMKAFQLTRSRALNRCIMKEMENCTRQIILFAQIQWRLCFPF